MSVEKVRNMLVVCTLRTVKNNCYLEITQILFLLFLILFLAEQREVYIALWIGFEIHQK